MDIRHYGNAYGKYNIFAYVNMNGNVYALSTDGRTYDMKRTWNNVYTESILRRIITETIDKFIKENTL